MVCKMWECFAVAGRKDFWNHIRSQLEHACPNSFFKKRFSNSAVAAVKICASEQGYDLKHLGPCRILEILFRSAAFRTGCSTEKFEEPLNCSGVLFLIFFLEGFGDIVDDDEHHTLIQLFTKHRFAENTS